MRHDLEKDLRELADNITECAVGAWYNSNHGCGCPLTQLAINKGICTDEEAESVFHVAGNFPALMDRMRVYYTDNDDWRLLTCFPVQFDNYADAAIEEAHIPQDDTNYVNDPVIIRGAMLAAIEKETNG